MGFNSAFKGLNLLLFARACIFHVSQSRRSDKREERTDRTDSHLFGICPYPANHNALRRKTSLTCVIT